MKRMLNLLLIIALLLTFTTAASAQNGRPDRPLPNMLEELKLDNPVTVEDSILDKRLVGAQGPQEVIVSLNDPSVAEVFSASDTRVDKSPQALRRQLNNIKSQQSDIVRFAKSLDPNVKILGKTQRVINMVALEIDGADLEALSKYPGVEAVRPVINYEMDLENSVPHVGGSTAHGLGYTGKGVTVAIIDSGVDYYHSLMGGSGDAAAYAADDPTIIEPGTFPTEKVIGGYDFVGGVWPNGSLMPDPDPLDHGSNAGHGTHVASTAAGLTGMAPEASVYALKVCSSVSTSCSGVAMIQALDWIVDPNGDGDPSDHVDVANMSIGSPYGQPWDDDTSRATEIAVASGVLVVTSTGNSSDKPYIGGTPGATMGALATAATNNPSSSMQLIEVLSPANIAGNVGAIWQPWSAPLTSVIEAPAIFAGSVGDVLACNPFPAGSMAGMIGIADRGSCAISIKVANMKEAGAVAAIVGLVAPGDPTEFAYGGGDTSIPGYNIMQSDSERIKAELAAGSEVVMRLDPANVENLTGVVIGFSSRGPASLNYIKPDIAAPGSHMAADVGTGTGLVQMAGTSMASPMVAGAGAVLKQAFPDLSPYELRAILVQHSETDILNKALAIGGRQAPITRIGGGEVRIDRAVMAKAAALEETTLAPSLSFGFVDADKPVTLTKTFLIVNYTDQRLTYKITPSFRFEEDAASGAVTIKTNHSQVNVKAHGVSPDIQVTITVDPSKLREWAMNSGEQGANGDLLTEFEFDGYVWLDDVNTSDDDADQMHLAWHVLPRLSAQVQAFPEKLKANRTARIKNAGAGPAYIDGYSLIATSPNLPEGGWGEQSPIFDLKYFGVQTFPVSAGFCSANESFVMAFAISTWERQTMANWPALFELDLDVDQDGFVDYAIYNQDLVGSISSADGRAATFVYNVATGTSSAFFYVDHPTNSSNTVLLICGEQIGMNASNFFQPMDGILFAVDNYFTGNITDFIDGITVAPLGERFFPVFGGSDFGSTNLASGAATNMGVIDFGPVGTNPGELGVLLINTAVRGDVSSGAALPYENTAIFVQP